MFDELLFYVQSPCGCITYGLPLEQAYNKYLNENYYFVNADPFDGCEHKIKQHIYHFESNPYFGLCRKCGVQMMNKNTVWEYSSTPSIPTI